MTYLQQKRTSYISFILPAFIIYIGIIIFPVLFSFYLSLTKWKGYGKMEFIGLGNYIRMFTDRFAEQYPHRIDFGIGTDSARTAACVHAVPENDKAREFF